VLAAAAKLGSLFQHLVRRWITLIATGAIPKSHQAQRDYFGAHTYERVDKTGAFHTEWTEFAESVQTSTPQPLQAKQNQRHLKRLQSLASSLVGQDASFVGEHS